MTALLEPPASPPRPRRAAPASGAPAAHGGDRRRVVLWREALLVLAFYGVYSWIRGRFGSGAGAAGSGEALANAHRVIAWQEQLGLPSELAVQQWFLTWPAVVKALNVFYGMFHFAVPVATLVVLARRTPSVYRRWRNALAATTALALVGFATFPLLPPRLLCDCPGGAGPGVDAGYVDTLAQFGGLWTFGSHGLSAVSNQHAAMPSLHFAWSLWCALALTTVVRSRRGRTVVALYPALTLLAIVVTANHFWLDAVGGAAVVGLGLAGAVAAERLRARITGPITRPAGLVPIPGTVRGGVGVTPVGDRRPTRLAPARACDHRPVVITTAAQQAVP